MLKQQLRGFQTYCMHKRSKNSNWRACKISSFKREVISDPSAGVFPTRFDGGAVGAEAGNPVTVALRRLSY